MDEVRHLEDQPNVSKEYQEDSHNDAPGRPPKRARTNASKQDVSSKKRVKGKQGGLQGIMKMPIEVFMEIAPYVNPGDLIALVRTSKFFRSMLLNQSAATIWQCALSNVPGLPPYPTGMVEPQYAALMFTKNCTICGAVAIGSKPDPYLRVRVCPPCRDTELVERLVSVYLVSFEVVPFTLHMKKTKKVKRSSFNTMAHQLRTQVQEFDNMRNEFIRKNDREGRVRWEKEREAAWATQRKEGDELLKYINSAAESRSTELQVLKAERQEQIHERLEALGWDEKYFNFRRGSDDARRQWHNLVDTPKSLTERTWTNMLPKLTQLLEENRPQVDEYEREQRLTARLSTAGALLRVFKKETNSFQPIVDALQKTGSMDIPSNRIMNSSPFPSARTFAGWDCIANLYQEEHSLERVEELFNERRDLIEQKFLEWRARVEDQLVKQYKSSFDQSINSVLNTALTVKGSSGPTKDLSDNARFLLRADTVFMKSGGPTCYTEVDQEHGPVTMHVHFPDIYPIQNFAYLYNHSSGSDPDEEARELEPYVRHAGKEAIIKALLKELDMPNAAHIELENMGDVFICGRCHRSGAMGWVEIVNHYHVRGRDRVAGKFVRNNFTTKHPVIVRNIHATAPGTSSQPLVRIGTDTYVSGVARCLICRELERYEGFESLEKMRVHMAEVHDATEPVEELHFITESPLSDIFCGRGESLGGRTNWEKKWDEHYGVQGGVSGETIA
ncbi:hypothetical protein B0J17DRAFT_767668 [Rhizoctonia solani]|nr:hypothetical protein B0J17DRAFT_767668 [Rhizoctonia solani]